MDRVEPSQFVNQSVGQSVNQAALSPAILQTGILKSEILQTEDAHLPKQMLEKCLDLIETPRIDGQGGVSQTLATSSSPLWVCQTQKKNQPQSLDRSFELIGVLKAWVQKPGKPIKAFWLSTAQGDYLIHVKKGEAKPDWLTTLPAIGESLRVIGTYKYIDKHKSKDQGSQKTSKHLANRAPEKTLNLPKLKLKAEFLVPLDWGIAAEVAMGLPEKVQTKSVQTTAKILVCQKSSCRSKGAMAIQKAVERHLEDQGLTGQVKVQGSGCLGCCKKAPCLMVMPNKDKHRNLKPADVSTILSDCW
jgi:NADH:ubiquinone oxidoreductase subunit E